jgi:hypothetical protein
MEVRKHLEDHRRPLLAQRPLQACEHLELSALDVDLDRGDRPDTELLEHLVADARLDVRRVRSLETRDVPFPREAGHLVELPPRVESQDAIRVRQAHGQHHRVAKPVEPQELVDEVAASDLRLEADILALSVDPEHFHQSLSHVHADIDEGARSRFELTAQDGTEERLVLARHVEPTRVVSAHFEALVTEGDASAQMKADPLRVGCEFREHRPLRLGSGVYFPVSGPQSRECGENSS